MSRAEEAVRLFQGTHVCSQAILIAFCQDAGLSSTQAARLGAGFGAGMRMGGTCGAVTAAVAVLGLKLGTSGCETGEQRAEVNDAVVEFSGRFVECMGSLACRDILGCDLGTPEGMRHALDDGLFDTVCVDAVTTSALLLEEATGASHRQES